MRAARVAAACLLVACNGAAQEPIDAMPHAPLSLDVSVSAQSLSLRTNATDQTCDCSDDMFMFAEVGTCQGIDDVIVCNCPPPSSCLTAKLTATGFTATLDTQNLLNAYAALPAPFPTDLALELGGCGRAPLTIPIELFVAPVPTVTTEVVDQLITARWQTDIAASSAYVTFGFLLWAHECHTVAMEQTYTAPGPGPYGYASVGVTTYLPPVVVDGDLGQVRIWRGASASVRL